MGTGENFIEVNNVSYSYPGSVPVLHDISFSVKKGEYLMIMGPNGSGKSTLAKMIIGLMEPTKGCIIVDGDRIPNHDADILWSIRRKIGWLTSNPDNHVVAPIVEDDVAFGPENYGYPSPDIKKMVQWALDETGTKQIKNCPVDQLSGGEKQKVALAGVLALHPQCLILDEPTSMVDRETGSQIQGLIKSLHQKDVAIIHITHDTGQIHFADSVIVLNKGTKVYAGSPQELLLNNEKMTSWGLEVPPLTLLAKQLLASGGRLPGVGRLPATEGLSPASLVTPEGLVEALCS